MEVGHHYERSRLRLTAMLGDRGGSEWDAPVPACPGWRVRDVLAHLVGNVEDGIAGRLTGPPSEAQTADQVRRHLEDDPADLLAYWSTWGPFFEAAITERGALPAAIDALTHEHDIRHGLGQPGGRDDELIPVLARTLLGRLDDHVKLVAMLDGVPHVGTGVGPHLSLNTTSFEVFRAAIGRRTRQQVLELDWDRDPGSVLDAFFVFGPAVEPLIESSTSRPRRRP